MTDSDNEATVAAEADPADTGEAGASAAVAVRDEPATAVAVHDSGETPATGWHRYALPFLTPLFVVLGIVFFVINVSRVFLASSEAVAVVIATIITVAILGGAALLSAAPEMRSSSIVLIVLGFFALVLMAGLLTLGPSGPKEAAKPFPVGKADQSLAMQAVGVSFQPAGNFTLHTGYTNLSLKDAQAGSHTLTPQESSTVLLQDGATELAVGAQGQTDAKLMFIGDPGTYTFFCAIPGHRAAGMVFTVDVTGPAVTQDQAATTVK